MFGWEFPPLTSGGLGTACFGLTRGLSNQGVNISFVMPRSPKEPGSSHVDLIFASDIRNESQKRGRIDIKGVKSLLKGYINSEQYSEIWHEHQKDAQKKSDPAEQVYGKDLYEEVYRFSQKARTIAKDNNFDIIHAHDWMTYPAAIQAKKFSNKPLVLHIHATEFDRTADHPNQLVYDIEYNGFHNADMILAVSERTRQKVINNYNVPPEKVRVVHNAVDFNLDDNHSSDCSGQNNLNISKFDKVVLFLGRITIQKGPEHFLWAAKKVLDLEPNVKFVVAGSGDMERRMIEESNNLNISDKVIFTGFLKGKDIDRAYSLADLYVMPSISEPFGITPLESMRNNTPVLISKQSGVSEVLNNCLKVDFWDIDQMANKIVSILRYKDLHEMLKEDGFKEVHTFNWDIPAKKCISAYNKLLKL